MIDANADAYMALLVLAAGLFHILTGLCHARPLSETARQTSGCERGDQNCPRRAVSESGRR